MVNQYESEQENMNGLLISKSMRPKVDRLSDEDAGKLFKLIFAYADDHGIEIPTDTAGTAFDFGFKDLLDKNEESYEKRCEVSRENGKKGGRPPKKAEETDELFDLFWNAYPNKSAKQTARKAFGKVTEKLLRETILPDLEKRRTSEQWTKDGGAYIPHASTYINQKRWTDPITYPRSKRASDYEQRQVKDSDFDDMFLDLNQDIAQA